ncbi:MAG: anti-sigma factor family protein [Phycisphaerae bacterium]
MKPDRSDYLEQQLSAYLDGEVTDAERAEVEAYLVASEDARRVFEELRRNAELLRSLPRAKAPDGLPELVTAELERRELLGEEPAGESGSRPAARGPGRWLASAAVIVLAASAGLLTFTHLRQGSPRPAPRPLGPIADIRDGSSRAARDEIRVAKPAEPAAKHGGSGGGYQGGGASSVSKLETPTVGGAEGRVYSDFYGHSAATDRVAQDAAAEQTYARRERQKLAGPGGRQDGGIAANKAAAVPHGPGPAPAEVPPAGGWIRSMGKALAADAALAWDKSRHIVNALDRYLDIAANQITTFSPAPVARGRTPAKAGAFEISLVYADQAAKDAAVGIISDTLSRLQTRYSAEARATSARRSGPGEPAHPEACFSYTLMPSAPGSRDNAIVVDATPETASVILSAIEDAGARIAPVSVSAQQGAALGWSAVQSLGREYVASCAGSPGDSAGASVASLTNPTGGETVSVASSGATPAARHNHLSRGVRPDAVVPDSSMLSEMVGVGGLKEPTSSCVPATMPAPGTVPAPAVGRAPPAVAEPAAVRAPAKVLAPQASATQVVTAAKANAPAAIERRQTTAVPTPRQSQEHFERSSLPPAARSERLQLLLRLMVVPEAALGRGAAVPATCPATSSPAHRIGP